MKAIWSLAFTSMPLSYVNSCKNTTQPYENIFVCDQQRNIQNGLWIVILGKWDKNKNPAPNTTNEYIWICQSKMNWIIRYWSISIEIVVNGLDWIHANCRIHNLHTLISSFCTRCSFSIYFVFLPSFVRLVSASNECIRCEHQTEHFSVSNSFRIRICSHSAVFVRFGIRMGCALVTISPNQINGCTTRSSGLHGAHTVSQYTYTQRADASSCMWTLLPLYGTNYSY